ncbi:MAG: GNAT family N-acetyltransferase [Pseudohongiella sp.]|uniref:GNAT family N-acetyltransferase n=1 Tax=Pseudohongiella sp. TaxID=1979412 RepID=UPI0034A04E2F
MARADFTPLDPRIINTRTFDCGKDAINIYLRRFAAKNMALNLNRTYVLPAPPVGTASKSSVVAYYTLALQTLQRQEMPDPTRLPRYPLPVILLAQLGVDRRFQGQGLGAKTLISALRHAYRVAAKTDNMPALGVILDVLDKDALRFYESYEFFAPLTDQPMRLFCPMAALANL